ncbi:hypothetical protein B0H19DRAFT_1133142, partial [Mycena capillaripes]
MRGMHARVPTHPQPARVGVGTAPESGRGGHVLEGVCGGKVFFLRVLAPARPGC